MKTTTRLLLPLALALTILAAPAVALAGPSTVHQALTGTVLDPTATLLRIVPPKGGMVLVYRNGKAVSWLMRAGYVGVKPNRIYGVVATRGTSVLFNAGIVARPGLTELRFTRDDQPQISYLPAYQQSWVDDGYYGSRHGRRAPQHVEARTPMGHATYRTLGRKLAHASDDWARVRVLKAYAKRYRFTHLQSDGSLKAIHDTRAKAAARTLIDDRARKLLRSGAARVASAKLESGSK